MWNDNQQVSNRTMKAFQDTDRVRNGLKEAITLLCKTGLQYQSELSIDGLLGITLDHNEVFLVSIQEVIKNPGDFNVSSSSKILPDGGRLSELGLNSSAQCRPEPENHTGDTVTVTKPVSAHRSRRKRIFSKAQQIVDLDVSRSSVDTEDSLNFYYDTEEIRFVKDQSKDTAIYQYQRDQDAYDDEQPLSLVTKKDQPGSKTKSHSDAHESEHTSNEPEGTDNLEPTDLRLPYKCSKQNEINKNSMLSQHRTIDSSRGRESNCDNAEPTDYSKAFSNNKSVNSLESDGACNESSPGGSQSPYHTSHRSTPNDNPEHSKYSDTPSVSEGSSSPVNYDNRLVIKDEPMAMDGYNASNCGPGFTGFMNVYESGTPTLSPNEGIEPMKKKTKLSQDLAPSAVPNNAWGMMFDPDSHAKWLQSIAAYVHGSQHPSASLMPPMTHQGLPLFGGTIPSAKHMAGLDVKPQVAGQLKGKSSSSSKSSSVPSSLIKIPTAVPKLVHAKSTHLCGNCGTQKTTTWRRGEDGTPLCNACGLYLKLHKPSSSTSSRSSPNPLRKVRYHQCSNCQTSVTTMWRRDSDGKPVCNACGLYYKLHKVNRPLTMCKTEIHSRRRKHSQKCGMDGKSEPQSPGNSSSPFPDSPLLGPSYGKDYPPDSPLPGGNFSREFPGENQFISGNLGKEFPMDSPLPGGGFGRDVVYPSASPLKANHADLMNDSAQHDGDPEDDIADNDESSPEDPMQRIPLSSMEPINNAV